MFPIVSPQPGAIWQNGWRHWIQWVKYVYLHPWRNVLIVVGGSSLLDLQKQRNWSCFNLYLHNQGCYGKTDGSIGFSASNMSIHMHGRRSNCSWGLFIAGFKKTAKLVTFQFISPRPGVVRQNG